MFLSFVIKLFDLNFYTVKFILYRRKIFYMIVQNSIETGCIDKEKIFAFFKAFPCCLKIIFIAQTPVGNMKIHLVFAQNIVQIINISHTVGNKQIPLFAVVHELQLPYRHPVKLKVSGKAVEFFHEFG